MLLRNVSGHLTDPQEVDREPPRITSPVGPAILFVLFLGSLLLDIGGAFGIKYATFIAVAFYVGLRSLRLQLSIPLSFLLIEGLLFGLAPLIFLVGAISVFRVAPSAAIEHLTPFPVWLLYPLLLDVRSQTRILSIYRNAMFVGAVLTALMFGLLVALFVSRRLDLITTINAFTDSHRLGFFGARPLGNETYTFLPNVYFRWTLLLLPAALLAAFERRTVQFLLFAAAILATLSTAAILFLLVGVAWIATEMAFRGESRSFYIRRALVLMTFLILCGIAVYASGRGEVVTFVLEKLSPESKSTSIKLEHIGSSVALLRSSVITLLFGMGPGSTFYSTGTHTVVERVEVSHLELVREFGLLYATAFVAYCIVLFSSLRRTDRLGNILGISMLVLFVAAGTNPVLISPIFFLILVISRAYVTLSARQQDPARVSTSVVT